MGMGFMIKRFSPLVVFLLLFLTSGCASWKAVPIEKGFWQEKGKRVGVALLADPSAEVQLNATPLSMGLRTGPLIMGGSVWDYPEHSDWPLLYSETRSVRDAARSLDAKEFAEVQDLFVQGLKEKGFDAFEVEQRIDEASLPPFKGQEGDAVYSCRDFRDILRTAHADNLVVLGLNNYGVICRYIGLNNFEVEVYAQAQGFMVDGATNRVLWRTGATEGYMSRRVNAECSRPDHIPVIVEALNALLKEAAGETVRLFFSSGAL